MYGEAFYHWQQAQKIIDQIEAEEPEVRAMVREHYKETNLVRFPTSMPHSPAELLQRQMEWHRRGTGVIPLNGLFGSLLSWYNPTSINS